jgi:hypothetical protein
VSYPENSAVSPDPARRRPSLGTISAVIGIVVSVLGLLVAVGQWLYPNDGHDDADTVAATTATSGPAVVRTSSAPTSAAIAGTTTATTDNAASAGTPLSAVLAEAGGWATLPRSADKAVYAGGVAIKCPSNESNNKVIEIVLTLDGRYLDLSTTVRAYDDKDVRRRVQVRAIAQSVGSDGGRIDRLLGVATTDSREAVPLGGAVDGAKRLRLQVSCDMPTSYAFITGRLTEAS